MHPGSAPALPPSAATRLRTVILNGELAPGTFLREVEWAKRLNVSRNTLREAMRDLIAQGLVEHRPHHGVAIRSLTEIEIREIYAIRMTLELRGVCHSAYASVDQMNTLIAQVGAMQEAARIDDWNEVATASLRFHRQIVSFIGSPRLNDLFTSVATQARLAFSYAPDMRRFQEPWIARDSQICAWLCDGNRDAAAAALELYLQESERVVLGAARSRALDPFEPAPESPELAGETE